MRRTGNPRGMPWIDGEQANARAEGCAACGARAIREECPGSTVSRRMPAQKETRMRIMPSMALTVALSTSIALAAGVARVRAADQATPLSSPTPAAAKGSKEVKLCDNKTTVQVPDDAPKTAAEGQKIADSLMAQWKTKHPDSRWVAEEVEAHQVVPPEQNSAHVGNGQGSTYGAVSTQDTRVWDNETYKTAVYGSTVFHSGDELGSEIAVS